MADDFSGILIKIDIANSQKIINTQMTEIQNWFKNNHNLKIDLNISDSALKGLEKLGKEFGNTTNGIRSGWKDITRDIEKLNNIKNIKIDMVEKDGISKAVQKVGELKTATGQTVQITQKLVNVHDDAGKIIGEKWVESTRKIKKLNQDTINKMGQDLSKFKAEFQNNVLKLDGSKSNSFVSNNDLKTLRELKAELGGMDIRNFNVPQDLKAKLDEIKSSFDKIKISADNAMKATKSLGTGNTGTSTETINKISIEIENLIKQYKAANISAKEFMDTGIKLAGNTDIDQRIKLLNVLKTAQKEYDSVINQESKTNSSISNNVYAQQKQALEGVYSLLKQKMDAEKKGQTELTAQLQEQLKIEGQKYALATKNIKSGGLTDSSREIELLNTKLSLQTEYNNRKTKEIDITRQNNQNNAYTQLEQSLKNILDLSGKRIDAEKREHIELTSQLQEQIRLEGQKYAVARQDIRSSGLSDSSREVEFLNLKNTLQTEYNNKKIREGDISRQNALDNQHWLSIQQQDFASQTTKFAQQKSGLYNTSEFERLQREMASLTPTTDNVRQKVDNLKASFRSLDAEAVSNGLNNANKSAMSFGESIQVAAYKMGIWLGVGNLIFGVISQLKQSLVFLSDMNQGFTNMSLEMTDVNLNFNEITQSANNYAIAMGTTTTAVMRGLEVFSTYNSTLEESIKKTQAAAIMSNITGQSMTDSADQLMGTLAQYRLGAEDALGIVDTIASVARNLQVDFPKAVSEISNGMRTVGAVSAEAGVSVQELSGMLGTLVETTRRSGSQVANGLKMIFSRLGNVGEDTNPEEFVRIEKSLYNIGITMKDSATSIKPASVLLREIASRWSTLNDIERQATATAVSSIFQRNIFVSLMQNYDKVLQNTTSATDANGVALQKQDIYMKSLKAHTSEFVASLQGLYLSMANQDTLKGLVDTGTGIVNVFSNLSSVLGTIPVLLGTAVVGIGLFSSKFREGVMGSVGYLKVLQMEMVKTNSTSVIGFKGFATAGLLDNMKNFSDRLRAIRTQLSIDAVFAGTSSNVSRLGTAFQALTGRTIGYTTAIIGARIATIAWQATLTVGLSFAISAIVSGIINFTQKTEKAKEAFETLTKSISQLKSETSEIPSLISQYEELFPKLNKTTEEKEKLSTATSRLSSLFGDSVIQLDSEGKAIQVDIEYVKQLTQAKKDLLITQQQELSSKFNSMGKDQYDEILEKQNRIKEINAEISEKNSKVTNLQNYNDSNPDDFISAKVNNKFIKDYQESIAELATERTKLSGESNEIQKTLSQEAYAFDQSTESSNKLSQSLINNLSKATFDSGKGFNDLLSVMGVFSKLDVSEVFKRISEDMTKGTTTEKATEDIKDMESALNKYGVEADIVTNIIKYFNNAIKLDNAPKTTNSIKGIAISSKELADSLKDVTSVATDVSKAMEEYNETGKLSASTIVDLVTKYPQLIDQLKVENGQLTLNKEAVQSLLQVRIDGMITSLQESIKFTEAEAENTKVRINNLILEAEAIERRNSAYNSGLPSFFKPTVDLTNVDATGGIPYANREEQLKSEAEARLKAEADILQKQIDADNATKDKIASMKALLGNIKSAAYSGSYPSAQKDKKEPTSSLAEQVDIEESLIRSFQTQVKQTIEQGKLLEKQLATAKSAKDYNAILSITNDLIENQKLQIIQLGEAKDKVEKEFAKVSTQSGFQNTSQWIDPNGEATLYYQEQWNASSVKTQKQMSATFDKLSKLQKAWTDNTTAINTTIEAQKAFSQQSREDLIKSLEEQSQALSSSETTSLESSFKNLDIESWIKDNITATSEWSDVTASLQEELEKLGNPTTFEGQKKYNEYLQSSAKLAADALKAQKDYQKEVEKAKQNALFESTDANLQEIMDKIDAVDQAQQLSKGGISSAVPKIDMEIVPRIDYKSVEEAIAEIPKPNVDEYEFTPPTTFVTFIHDEFTNAVLKAKNDVADLTLKINSLGEITPANQTEVLGYYQKIQDVLTTLSKTASEAEVGLNISLKNGEISQEDFDERLKAIQVADLEVLAVPKFEMTADAQASLDAVKEKIGSIAVNTDTEEANKKIQDLIKDNEVKITAIFEDSAALQAKAELQIDTSSIHTIYVQTVEGEKPEGFAKGTNYSPSGLAIVSEKGRELIKLPNGSIYLSGDDGAELVNLPKGTEVTPNDETERILKLNNGKIPAYAEGTGSHITDIDFLNDSLDEFAQSISDVSKEIAKTTKIVAKDNTAVEKSDKKIAGYEKTLSKYSNEDGTYKDKYVGSRSAERAVDRTQKNIDKETAKNSELVTKAESDQAILDAQKASKTDYTQKLIATQKALANLNSAQYIEQKINLYQEAITVASENIDKLYDSIAKYKNEDGTYEDNEQTRAVLAQIKSNFEAQKSAQLSIKQLVKERFEAEYEGFDKAQAKAEAQVSYLQKTLEYQKLIGASIEDQLATEQAIQDENQTKMDSLQVEKTKAEADKAEAEAQVKADLAKVDPNYTATDLSNALANSQEYNQASEKLSEVNSKIIDANIAIKQTAQEIENIKFDNLVKPFKDAIAHLQVLLQLLDETDFEGSIANIEAQMAQEVSIIASIKQQIAETLADTSLTAGEKATKVSDLTTQLNEAELAMKGLINSEKEFQNKQLAATFKTQYEAIEKTLFNGSTEQEAQDALNQRIALQEKYLSGVNNNYQIHRQMCA